MWPPPMPRMSVKVLGECDDTRAPSFRGPAEAVYAPSDSPSAATAATVICLIHIDNGLLISFTISRNIAYFINIACLKVK
jgi:hypothetical protein